MLPENIRITFYATKQILKILCSLIIEMCKLSHYGNCDEETKNEEYCIFHKPNKNEEEAREFYEKFLRRFKHHKEKIEDELSEKRTRYVFEEDLDCKGFVFPEIREHAGFIFWNAKFLGNNEFSGAVFEGPIMFTGSVFEGSVDFSGTIFKDDVMFYEALFNGHVTFGKSLDKSGITIFEKSALFDKTIFRKGVWFNAELNNASFVETIFEGNVSFGDSLSATIFKKGVTFERAIFKKNVIFGATFRGFVSFIGTTFEGITDFSIKNEKYKFYDEMSFLFATFKRGIIMDIPSEWFKLPHAETEARRVQRICYEKEGKRDDADRMFLLEKRALRRARRMDAKEKSRIKYIYECIRSFVEFLIADLTCKYGTSWRRAILLWTGVVLAMFPFLYFISNGVKVGSFLNYFYFSIVTATTLGYGDFHPVGWGKALASMEAIFGTFMWAVFIAVFARKYMR
ncbi:MAG: hypothetical protein FE041_04340 [Thermoplasmata archaeon]|nr:MAG: hypothetical protein FE041_04340 [Thermoplasmata archaeon]